MCTDARRRGGGCLLVVRWLFDALWPSPGILFFYLLALDRPNVKCNSPGKVNYYPCLGPRSHPGCVLCRLFHVDPGLWVFDTRPNPKRARFIEADFDACS